MLKTRSGAYLAGNGDDLRRRIWQLVSSCSFLRFDDPLQHLVPVPQLYTNWVNFLESTGKALTVADGIMRTLNKHLYYVLSAVPC